MAEEGELLPIAVLLLRFISYDPTLAYSKLNVIEGTPVDGDNS